MGKILFITTRNILTTSGELRLIKNRSKAIFEKWNIVTDYIVICNKNKIKLKNEEVGTENSKTTIISCNDYNPISIFNALRTGKKKILSLLKSGNYKCVILSGIGTLSFTSIIKTSGITIPVIADIHGAKEELIEFNEGNTFKQIYRRLLYSYIKYSENKYLPHIDGSLVVSKALSNYLIKSYKLNNFNYYVVPCAIEGKRINLNSRNLNREKYREKYGIKPEEVLFIYSGGVSPWQCINNSIEIFSYIQSQHQLKVKMLILSHHIEKIRPLLRDYQNIILDSVNADKVKDVLCAGDYAFLIRDNYITNNVAYPNKFLEYVESGMNIITTPNVYDVAQQVNELDLGICVNYQEEGKILDYIKINSFDNQSKKRDYLLKRTSFNETLVDFVNDFKLAE